MLPWVMNEHEISVLHSPQRQQHTGDQQAVGGCSLGRCGVRCTVQDDDKLVTLQVGKTVWEQAPRQMRVELWMSALQRRGVGVAAAAKYEDMLLTVSSGRAGAQAGSHL